MLRSLTLRRALRLVLLALAACLAAQAGRAADAGNGEQKLYQGLLPSTVWINVVKKQDASGKTEFLSGSGAVVDLKQRLVLTNYHVVRDREDARVLFPVTQEKRLVRDRAFYTGQILRSGVPGKVIARDAARDLALLQLSSLPPGTRAVRLAAKSVEPGDRVYSLGNPGESDKLWVFRTGSVRRLGHEKFHSRTVDGFELDVEADLVVTDAPNRPGESGGPLINERGELAGVVDGHRTERAGDQETHSGIFIDLSDVRGFLDSRLVTAKPATPAKADGARARAAAETAATSRAGLDGDAARKNRPAR
jgi:S1-C subfamily serine protease